ncbi:MAG TPA: lysoplasmalogenase [Chitinophagaceae bacterium]|nr:lysoplasmalogenase [Chitinophagaceae bacterium]
MLIRKTNWLYPFFAFFIADLTAIYLGEESFRQVTKPFLMIFLILFFNTETFLIQTSLKKFIVLALIFSWLGDVLLMFETRNENFFIFGLVAFLMAHIFYILFFEKIILKEKLKKRYWIFLPVMVYYVVLISVLSPTLEELKWPVRVYGIIISYMLIKAFQSGGAQNRKAVLYLITGAVLFVISDSVLAFNKFYRAFEYAGILIMVTYGMAQLLITFGAVRYITNSLKK